MSKPTTRVMAWIIASVSAASLPAFARQAGECDAIIDTIRTRTDIGPGDQDRIARCIAQQIDTFTAPPEFRQKFAAQFTNASNTPAFNGVWAAKVGEAAAAKLTQPGLKKPLSQSIARVMADMARAETFPGLLAGLKSTDSWTRFLCAATVAGLRAEIAGDKARVDQAVQALREAGLAENSPVVLSRIYLALGYASALPAVLDAYLAIFDKRLEARRASPSYADGKELDAFEFFRTKGVNDALDANQKQQLAVRLAVFLRMDAERYAGPNLTFEESDALEHVLWVNEEVLAALAGKPGGDIRGKLQSTGSDDRPGIVAEAYKWVGKPGTSERGPLNDAPWNVPLGAP